MKKLIIGFGSRSRIGKDFAFDIISKHYNAEKRSQSDMVREGLKPLLAEVGLDSEHLTPEDKEKARGLMLSYGETMRAFDEDFWMKKVFSRPLTADITVLTAVRYPNEVRKIHELGGYYIDIDTDTPAGNQSEATNSPICRSMADFIIFNDFTPNYEKALLKVIEQIRSENVVKI